MSDKDKIIEKLFSIAEKQQKVIGILAKRAQSAPNPAPDHYTGHDVPAAKIEPNKSVPGTGSLTRDLSAEAILKSLSPVVKAALRDLKVDPSQDPQFDGVVKVMFHPGRGSDAAFAAIQKAVTTLQQQNVLKGKAYNVQEVA